MATKDEAHDATAEGPSGSRPRRVRTLLAVVLGLLVGVAVAVVASGLLSSDDDGAATPLVTQPTRTLSDDEPVDSPADLLPDEVPLPPGAGAASAEAAVTGFLDAEVAGDLEASFGFLSADERTIYGTPPVWIASHADVIPPVTGYEIDEVTEGPDDTTVAGTVSFTPSLDQVVGLVPAQARVRWLATLGPDGAWGVSVESSAFEPLRPSDDGVAPAARTWADARRSCEVPANELTGRIGSSPLAESLCDAGDVTLTDSEVLDSATSSLISTAFGADTSEAARLVRISGGAELGIVLVPIGDEWTVIGVVP